jgi:4-carboxymuconolactone decarboxylase
MTEPPEDMRARGLAKMNEVYGWDMPDQKGDFFAVTADHLFADIWTRPGLDIAQRRLLLIGALAATRNFDILAIQLDSAYRLGELDDTALREIVIFMAHYVGWPVAATLSTHVEKLIAKQAKANTAE